MSFIEISNVTKRFDDQTVLKNVTMNLEAGKIHGIVGNNGSGKTVLMKCICGFLQPDEGFVKVDGKIVGVDMDFPDDMGLIIETPGFLPQLSGKKNLKRLAQMKKKITDIQIEEAMRRVELDPNLKRPVGNYSLGMRQRLGIAQAIMEDPALLILDEPFNGLDKNMTAKIRELLLSLKKEGKTILLSSHQQADIDLLCDTVWEADAGTIRLIPKSSDLI